MTCPSCGTEVTDTQRFCHECGAVLPGDGARTPEPVDSAATEPVEATPLAPPGITEVAAAPTEPVEAATAPTEPVDVDDGPNEWAEPTSELAPPSAIDTTVSPITATPEVITTEQLPTTDEPLPVTDDRQLFDGHDDLAAFPEPREPFQVRLSLVLALFGFGAVLMAIVADVIDLRTTRPVAGIATGAQSLDDLSSNLAVAGVVGTAVMVIGGLLACFGLRWGAGLAGGAGLAVAGWAGLSIGLAEFPIAVAESITRTSSEQFTLRVTRDLGWWLIAGVGVVGVLVFLASLRSIGTGRRAPLNPLIAAFTAVATAVLAFGPLVPVGDAVFADNFRSVDPNRDLPTAFFAGRIGQVALIALAGVVGMLIVRNYGLGLAVGGLTVATWMWASSLLELGDRPVGIADRNPGAADTVPHAVTTTGMVASLALLLVAAILATVRSRRHDRAAQAATVAA